MKVAVIIPAAGASRRYAEGAEFPRSKLDEDLGGRPVLQRTVELFTKHDAVSAIVVAGPADPSAFDEFKGRHGDKLGLLGVTIVAGGKKHRHETVAAALGAIPEDASHVAVHDAARPCTPMEMLDRVLDAAERHEAVVPAIDASDTLKRVSERDADDEADPLAAILGGSKPGARQRVVEATVDREGLVAVQTPQVFRADLLRSAYAALARDSGQPGFRPPTDDAEVVERFVRSPESRGAGGTTGSGRAIVIVPGDPRNIKITRPIDLHLARLILGVRDGDHRPVHKRF